MRSNDVDNLIAAERKILTFTLGEQVFGIDMEPLIEVREWEAPTSLPGVPNFIRGAMNLRGVVLPIVDLAERLGWNSTSVHPRSCIVVVRLGKHQAGFLVHSVADIIPIRDGDVYPCPDVEMAEKGAIAGVVQLRSRTAPDDEERISTVILLNLEALQVTETADLAVRDAA